MGYKRTTAELAKPVRTTKGVGVGPALKGRKKPRTGVVLPAAIKQCTVHGRKFIGAARTVDLILIRFGRLKLNVALRRSSSQGSEGDGARHLKRAIERYVVSPLARLLATAQVRPGDVLIIDRHPGEKGLVFLKDTNQQSFCSQMPFVASISRNLAAAEVPA